MTSVVCPGPGLGGDRLSVLRCLVPVRVCEGVCGCEIYDVPASGVRGTDEVHKSPVLAWSGKVQSAAAAKRRQSACGAGESRDCKKCQYAVVQGYN